MILSILRVLMRQLDSIVHFAHAMTAWLLYTASRLRRAFHVWIHHLRSVSHRRRYWRVAPSEGSPHRSRAKPEWVKLEVLRLKALMPHGGCRKIADCFNRRFALARQMTIGKTYVSDTVRNHLYEIQVLRKQIKNAKPKAVPRNLVWALDLTGKTTLARIFHHHPPRIEFGATQQHQASSDGWMHRN